MSLLNRLILFSLFAFLLQGCYVLFPKKYYRKAVEKAPYDAIIVPGYPYNEEDTTWNRIIQARLLWSTWLYKKGITKRIIYSGSDVHSPYVEALYMAQYGKALGIPEQVILLDTLAEHSSENVFYGFLLAKEKGFEKIALATDPFQAGMMRPVRRRVKRIFKHKVDHIPIIFDTIKIIDTVPHPIIDPSPAYRSNHVSLKEREGFFKRLSGTLGMKINWKKYRKEERKKRKERKNDEG